jgi:hypothetical protein
METVLIILWILLSAYFAVLSAVLLGHTMQEIVLPIMIEALF